MTVDVCPYCRAPLSAEEPVTACEGCGARHHSDCYAENGGCTIFGCSCAPAEEPKLTVSAPDLLQARHSGPTPSGNLTSVATPPPGAHAETSLQDLQRISSAVVPSMFSLFGPETVAASSNHEPEPVPADEPKDRTIFIVAGALLGAFGAHNFYAGYYKKAIAQLAITVITLGFGSPMSWIWAIIDICTINHDARGIQFES